MTETQHKQFVYSGPGPYQLRGGGKAEVKFRLPDEMDADYPIVGYERSGEVMTWKIDGTYLDDPASPLNLVGLRLDLPPDVYADGNEPRVGDVVRCVDDSGLASMGEYRLFAGKEYVVRDLRHEADVLIEISSWRRHRFVLVRRCAAKPDATPVETTVTPDLSAAIEKARGHVITDDERAAQAQSWVRGNTGADRDEQKTTAEPFRVTGLGLYETRIGEQRRVIGRSVSLKLYPWQCEYGRTVTDDGLCMHGEHRPDDLVRLISLDEPEPCGVATEPAEPPAQSHTDEERAAWDRFVTETFSRNISEYYVKDAVRHANEFIELRRERFGAK